MKGWVAFHKIPEVLSLMTWFQRRLIMKDKAGGHSGTMKTFFHYNQTIGDVNHFPQVRAFLFLHICPTLITGFNTIKTFLRTTACSPYKYGREGQFLLLLYYEQHKSLLWPGKRRLLPTSALLYKALVEHGISDFDKACNVGTHYQVTRLTIFLGGLEALLVDGNHNVVEPLINLFTGPGKP